MIPYFALTYFTIGPFVIHVWGLLVALGFLLGTAACAWQAKKQGLNANIFWDLLIWVVIGSMLFGRLFHVIFYEPVYFLQNPIKILSVWEGGFSMMGGLVGALFLGIWFLYFKRVKILSYLSIGFFGLPLGIGIGRIGCFLIHDHPGTPTDFILGVKYPDGIVRHDHGLYLSLEGFLLFFLFLWLQKKSIPQGTFLALFLIIDGITRFFLDFLRATDIDFADVRYAGLTPAQYMSIFMIGIGGYFFFKWFKQNKRKNIHPFSSV